jgi:hypothetical protein
MTDGVCIAELTGANILVLLFVCFLTMDDKLNRRLSKSKPLIKRQCCFYKRADVCYSLDRSGDGQPLLAT